MVMHARKTQRANDGYFEKHQSHPYQNSKYNSSKNFGSSAERYDRIRDSPNGNYRSDSPDSQSPRDRDKSYQSKSSYLQKIREKERENRDYKLSRDKYSDCRSPKEKRNRESEHRTNHDRSDEKGLSHPNVKSQSLSSRDRKPVHNNCVDKRDDRERVPRIGDWSEHISSSGKKYYYNCKTEVSQWEKPREWIDRERERERERDRDRDRERERDRDRFRNRDRDRDFDRSYGNSSRSSARHDKHSNTRGSNGNTTSGKDLNRSGGDNMSGGGSTSTSVNRHWNTGREDSDNLPRDTRPAPRKYSEDAIQSTQDMDISPGDSTPTSETSYGHRHHQASVSSGSEQQGNVVPSSTMGPVLLSSALPRLVSHPPVIVHHHQHVPPPTTPTSRPDVASPCYTNPATVVPPPLSVATSNTPGPPLAISLSRMVSQPVGVVASSSYLISSPAVIDGSETTNKGLLARQQSSGAGVEQPLCVEVNNGGSGAAAGAVIAEGPPTPTHSETLDCGKATVVTTSLSSPPGSSLPSLQSVSSSLQALRPQGPTLTPSLANYYRDDLVNHVRGWPAEILEKQADKLAQDAFIMSSIQCAKVSAELKSARSIVRLTEIQATLQEQRILFLRQQIKMLEEMKSQNSFMSDDS